MKGCDMSRTADLKRKALVLSRVADAVLKLGLVGVPLSRIAQECGTSARMLLHYFGSREALIMAALDVIRGRHLTATRQVLPSSESFLQDLESAWDWFAGPEARRYFLLFQQVAAIERLDPHSAHELTPRLTLDWMPILAAGFRAAGYSDDEANVMATVYLAQVRGLLLDLFATGDAERTSAAYDRFIVSLKGWDV